MSPSVLAGVNAVLAATVLRCRRKIAIVNGQPLGELNPSEKRLWNSARKREARRSE